MLVTQSHFDDGSNNILNLRRKNKKLFLALAVLLLAITACVGFVFANAQEGEDFEIKWIIPRENYSGNHFADGRAWVQKEKDGAWTLYDVEGNVIKDGFEAKLVGYYENGFASFYTDYKDIDNKIGLVDISGDIVVPPGNGGCAELREGLILASKKRLWGFFDMSGAWVIPAEYGGAEAFSEGLAAVRRNGKWGYIDKGGAVVIDFIFDVAESFVNGSAVVVQDSKCGMIDKSGNFLVEPIYDNHFNFGAGRTKDDLIEVVRDGMVGFMNRSGDVVIDFKFYLREDISRSRVYNIFRNGRAVVYLSAEGKERAVIDEQGNVVFKIEDEVRLTSPMFKDDYISGGRGEKFLIFDKNGKIFDITRHIDYPVLSSNNVFANVIMNTSDMGIVKVGYFVISQKSQTE